MTQDKEVEIHPIHQEVELTDEGAKILEQILSDPNSPKGRAMGRRHSLVVLEQLWKPMT